MELPIEAGCDALMRPCDFLRGGHRPAHVVRVIARRPEYGVCGDCGSSTKLWAVSSPMLVGRCVVCECDLTRLGPDPDALTEPTKEEISA